uniref:Olfactory receptor n=1 Tax=Chrysemys picta bellii TaxID=8478 RepID=A0A8C3I7U4_CHRPI
MGNLTVVTEFILLGLSNHRELEVPLFSIYLLFYAITLTGNILLITITMDPALHTPMYFFLRVLSFLEICYTSVTVPKMLVNFLSEDKSISYMGCFVQMYFLLFLGVSECFLLAAMAYDRYVAICNPLRYRLIMNRMVCLSLAVLSWFSGNVVSLIQTVWVFTLPFCGSNKINYFFCDIPPLIKLSCIDTSQYEMQLFTAAILVIFTPFTLILVSYIFIISTILKMASAEGRHKAFSTCSSHLIVVTLYYGYLSEVGFLNFSLFLWLSCFVFIIVSYVQIFTTVVRIPSEQGRHKAFSTCLPHLIVVSLFLSTATFAYLKPISSSPSVQNLLVAVLYSVLPPMMNPIIYSMRNKELKGALSKLIGWRLIIKN